MSACVRAYPSTVPAATSTAALTSRRRGDVQLAGWLARLGVPIEPGGGRQSHTHHHHHACVVPPLVLVARRRDCGDAASVVVVDGGGGGRAEGGRGRS
jgi:hypothetical protein